MFNEQIWKDNKEHFVRSYQNICPVIRKVGYAEMINHQFLTSDRSVQKTIFSNGVSIVVNFSDKSYRLPGGGNVSANDFYVVSR